MIPLLGRQSVGFSLLLAGLAGCSSDDPALVAVPDPAAQPRIVELTVSPTVARLDALPVGAGNSRQVSLSLNAEAAGPAIPLTLRWVLRREITDSLVAEGTLSPSPEDRFSGAKTVSVPFRSAGRHVLTLVATDASGVRSAPALAYLDWTFQNAPPAITAITLPASLKLPTSGSTPLNISVTVADSNGVDDVALVRLVSIRPDGVAANNGSPFPLTKGAGGVWTFATALPSDSQTGIYKFRFEAIDRAGASSGVVERTVEVTL